MRFKGRVYCNYRLFNWRRLLDTSQKHCRSMCQLSKMACSRFEYVKSYESDDSILPNVWIVIRVDGKGFHKFSKLHNFVKPNDCNALNLMNHAAQRVMEEFRDCILAYGQSDEYSFIFNRHTNLFNRRASKLLSYVVSLFTSSYVMNWSQWMKKVGPLRSTPFFDGRVVLYPTDQNLRDYLSWRQADVHVNNLYNTTFWSLVLKAGFSTQEAEAELRGTLSSDKNELLYSQFNINYNDLPAMFRKGTILLRKRCILRSTDGQNSINRQLIVPFHEDMISDTFWKKHTELLGKYQPGEHIVEMFGDIESSDDAENTDELFSLQFHNLKVSLASKIHTDNKTESNLL